MNMRWTLGLSLWLALAAAPAEAARRLGSLEFEPCTLAPALMPVAVDAQCATLEVPEDRANPEGRRIELAIAWVPAESKTPQPDPVFMLAGGRGHRCGSEKAGEQQLEVLDGLQLTVGFTVRRVGMVKATALADGRAAELRPAVD